MATIEYFEKYLRHALDHIYEPEVLRSNPIKPFLMRSEGSDSSMEFSQFLVKAIESLKPSLSTPVEHPGWRTYELLSFRYVQCAKQADLARQFSCSVRQLRREQERAISVLADHLINKIAVPLSELQEIEEIPELHGQETNPIEGEYHWLSDSSQSEVIHLGEELQVLYNILKPIVQERRVEIVYSGENRIVRTAIPAAALRQALISVVSSLILIVLPKTILVKTAFESKKALIQIICNTDKAELQALQMNQELRDAETLLRLGKGSIHISTVPGSQVIEIVFPVMVMKKVVVVDDNNDMLQLIERYTRNSRYQVIPCNHPGLAVSLIEQEQPDVVVLDVMMRSLDGWQLFQQIRASTFGNRPIVFCTVLAQERLAKTMGADGYINKPVNQTDFLTKLDELWIKNEQPKNQS